MNELENKPRNVQGTPRNKGGRPLLSDVQKHRRIIEKAWDVLEQYIDMPNLPADVKVAIAHKIAMKDMPTNVITDGDNTEVHVHINKVDLTERLKDYIRTNGDNRLENALRTIN